MRDEPLIGYNGWCDDTLVIHVTRASSLNPQRLYDGGF